MKNQSVFFSKLVIQKYRAKEKGDLIAAALFSRLCVEAKLKDFSKYRDDVSEKTKNEWRSSVVKKDLDRIFKNDDMIVEMDTGNAKWYYTPVREYLHRKCKYLDNWLHYNESLEHQEENSLAELEVCIREIIPDLVEINLGSLLGPPIYTTNGDENTIETPFQILPEMVEYWRSSEHTPKTEKKSSFHPKDIVYKKINHLPNEYLREYLRGIYGVDKIEQILEQ